MPKVVGDIRTARIVIEDGAYFKGSIDIIRAEAPKPASASAAAPKPQPVTTNATPSPAAAASAGDVKAVVAQSPIAGSETRQSHGLDQFCASLEERPGMSILDFAGASQATVSFVTNYGHRLFSDDFVRQLDRVFGSAPADANDAEFFENQANPALASDFLELAFEL